jgi:hypothetical protein
MARPKKRAELRSHVVSFRLTGDEMAKLQEEATRAGLVANDYAREKTVRGSVRVIQTRELPFPLINELRRIGNNINQQTRLAHANGGIPPELHRLWAKLETILDEIIQQSE